MEQQRIGDDRVGRGSVRAVLLVAVALSLVMTGFGAGILTAFVLTPRLQSQIETLTQDSAEEQVSREDLLYRLWEAWDILDREYLVAEDLDPDTMMRGAVAGAVASLDDPYTVLVDPVPAAILDEDMQGSFEGIGATVAMLDGNLTIAEFLATSPAQQAGLRVGDIILEVDGKSLDGLGLYEAIALIRGPRDSVVRLLVKREGRDEPFIVPVTRMRLELPVVEARMLAGNIAYLRLTEFNAVAGDRLHKALSDLLAKEPRGLILDLRGNPGGFFKEALDIADEFLQEGQVIVSEEERDQPIEVFEADETGMAADIPLVVLIDGGSASAAEIVAGALRANDRAVLIGEESYGKGSVQNVHTLADGSSLRVTIAKYYLPGGQYLDGHGLIPDIKVSASGDTGDPDTDLDPQVARAVAYLVLGE